LVYRIDAESLLPIYLSEFGQLGNLGELGLRQGPTYTYRLGRGAGVSQAP